MNLDSRWVAASSLLLALCLSIFACGKAVPNTGTDSATHWLSRWGVWSAGLHLRYVYHGVH